METKANYVLIGIFSVLVILAGLGFFLWLAKLQIDRQYAQYDVLFSDVAGLGRASPVRFNGVDVGQVTAINLDLADTSQVRVRIEVSFGTPIRADTIATLSAQGVTGVAYVGLQAGAPDALPLLRKPGEIVPVIPSESSVVQALIEDAPDLLSEAISLLRDLGEFTNDENRARVSSILENVDLATARLNVAMDDLTKTSTSISEAADEIAQFTAQMGTIAIKVDTTVTSIDTVVSGRLPGLVDQIEATLTSLRGFTETGLPEFAAFASDARQLADDIRGFVRRIDRDPARFFLGNRSPEYLR